MKVHIKKEANGEHVTGAKAHEYEETWEFVDSKNAWRVFEDVFNLTDYDEDETQAMDDVLDLKEGSYSIDEGDYTLYVKITNA